MTDVEFRGFCDTVENTISAQVEPPRSRIPGDQILKRAQSIFNKIDVDGTGFVDKEKMRAYCARVLSFMNPGAPVDEVALDKGFKRLDKDRDGKVTLFDMMQYVAADQGNLEPIEIPAGFRRYRESLKSNGQ